MAEHLMRYHTEYQTTQPKDYTTRDIFVLIEYLLDEIEELKSKIEKNTSK